MNDDVNDGIETILKETDIRAFIRDADFDHLDDFFSDVDDAEESIEPE